MGNSSRAFKRKDTHSELLSEVYVLDQTILKYENMVNESAEFALNDTVEQLKEDIGLAEFTGPGSTINCRTIIRKYSTWTTCRRNFTRFTYSFISMKSIDLKHKIIEVDGKTNYLFLSNTRC